MSKGYIKLFRQLKDWEWYSDKNVSRVFIDLLLSVNFKPKKWQNIEIKRGQIVIGLSKYATEIGLTTQELRTVLKKLKNSGEITTKATNKYTTITICKYELYQESESDINNQTTNEQQTNNKRTTNEQQQLNNEKKERIKELEKRERESKEEIEFLKNQVSQLVKNQSSKEKEKSSDKKEKEPHEFPDITAQKTYSVNYDDKDMRAVEPDNTKRPFSHDLETARQTLDCLFPNDNNFLKTQYKHLTGQMLSDKQIAHAKSSYISNLKKMNKLCMISHILEFKRMFLEWWIEKDLKYQSKNKAKPHKNSDEIVDGINLTYSAEKNAEMMRRYS